MRHAKTAVIALLLALAVTAARQAAPILMTHIDGFAAVNEDRVLDGGEPVSITTAFATNRSGTGQGLQGVGGTAREGAETGLSKEQHVWRGQPRRTLTWRESFS